jgi:hypothetical protein
MLAAEASAHVGATGLRTVGYLESEVPEWSIHRAYQESRLTTCTRYIGWARSASSCS